MQILVVNPNTSTAMTEQIRASAVAAAPPGVSIVAVSALSGPKEIESPEMAAAQAPVVIATIAANHQDVDAAIIAAFSDPGLSRARMEFPFPVVGIGESVLLAAAAVGRFVLVVPNPANQSTYASHLKTYGVLDRFIGIRYVYPALLEGRQDPDAIQSTLLTLIKLAIDVDGAQAIAIGGGPLAGMGATLTTSLSVPVFDSVPAAVQLAIARVRGGSK